MVVAVLAGCAQVPRSGGATPPPAYASGYFDRAPCADRIGRCFGATIGGQPVEVIATREEFERLRAGCVRSTAACAMCTGPCAARSAAPKRSM